MTQKFESYFSIGDKVIIDGNPALVMRVVAVKFHSPATYEIEVAWLFNGELKTVSVLHTRATKL